MAKTETKKWYQSKTLLINGLAIIAGVAADLSGQLEAGVVLNFMGVVGIVLRYVTKSAIK